MNQKSQRVLDACVSTVQHLIINPLTPAVPRVTALSAELTTATDALREYGAAQFNHRSAFRGAVDNRVLIRDKTLEVLRQINKIARALNKAAFPNARENFRMPLSTSYANIAAAARSFATHGEAMEQAFIDRGRPATFVADLRALATGLDASASARQAGLTEQVGATVGIAEKTRQAVAILRELDAIITPLIQSDLVLLASWKSAVHIESAPVGAEEEEEPTGSGVTGTAEGATTAGGGGSAA
jgi:hypothetical protein